MRLPVIFLFSIENELKLGENVFLGRKGPKRMDQNPQVPPQWYARGSLGNENVVEASVKLAKTGSNKTLHEPYDEIYACENFMKKSIFQVQCT